MESLRIVFEKEILTWKNAEQKKMFGCPCVKVNGKLFAFLVTNGIVITRLLETQKNEVIEKFHAIPYKTQTRTMNKWVQISYRNHSDFPLILPYLQISYKNAMKEK
ncbi:MAG: hypothetical protein EU530_06675 [Promethearchaeota archaeon]|nr:MAG: hypothetical protein EU530_06675 [Candidatus Lokiarchaeota archaeon]